jgi:serpin B
MNRCLLLALLAACNGSKSAAPPSPPPAPEPLPAPAVADVQEAPVHQVKTDMPPAGEIASLVKANNHFALELWAHASAGNVAISPVSISSALAMAWAGAKGDTAAEMRKTMHLEGETDLLVSQWARVSYALQDPKRPFLLKMANRLFGDAHYQFDTIYFTITRKAFSAPLEIIDFRADPEAAREKINTWVADQTEQRITDLIPPKNITADTRLVIVNAIYFLADWVEPFDKTATFDADFHVSATQNKRVPTMHRQDTYKLAKADGATLLEMPYQGGSAAMYILLPDKVDGLADVERTLRARLETLQRKLADETVLLSLPRFRIEPSEPLRLARPLQALGMKQAFDAEKADFTGIANPPSPGDRLFISEVLHEAFVKVDEKGTEAAAATAVLMPRGTGRPPQAIPFTADHPFLFLIVDKGSGLILFIGRVVEPKAP